jgi:peptide chain release factor subunit 1
MTKNFDLTELAEMTAPERAFLTVCLSGPKSERSLADKFRRTRRVLAGTTAERDEREHFDENTKAIRKYLDKHPLRSGALCIFSCWALDFFQAVPLSTPLRDLVWVDSSPYIRPLAELQDEYESVAVVVADNKKARIFLVTAAVATSPEVIQGNIKNHVRKGGWSQQRYERRRDKQLLLYAREIIDALLELDKEEAFRRILLVGGKEILHIVHEHLPQRLQKRIAEKPLDLGKGEGAARAGRVERLIVSRAFRPRGNRCRQCKNLQTGSAQTCSACGSDSLFEVDVVNEIVEMLKLSGGETDFADPIPTLAEAGEIAALLRYRT